MGCEPLRIFFSKLPQGREHMPQCGLAVHGVTKVVVAVAEQCAALQSKVKHRPGAAFNENRKIEDIVVIAGFSYKVEVTIGCSTICIR